MTKGLLISIKNKQKLYHNFFLNGTAFGKHFYKAYANKLTQVKNLSKKMYYTEFISKNKSNPKKMWEIWEIPTHMALSRTMDFFIFDILFGGKRVFSRDAIASKTKKSPFHQQTG